MATRISMAHGVLQEFDPEKESIEDFRERFDFYCVANKINTRVRTSGERKCSL